MRFFTEGEPSHLDFYRQVLWENKPLVLAPEALARVRESYDFLKDFAHGKVIYGVNTGFGPMAQYKVPEEELKSLQYNLIRSHAAGVGQTLSPLYAKAAMLCRLLSILRGASGVHPEVPELLVECINRNIIAVIYEHGSVGASGDLVQLAHLALALIGEGQVWYKGEIRPTAQVFEAEGLRPIRVHLREGLSLINGTSVMTGIGLVNLLHTERLLGWSLAASCVVNDLMSSYNESFSEGLNKAKGHPGQQEVAAYMRKFLHDSQLISSRSDTLYKHIPEESIFQKKIQSYYSLRCVPQILGPVWDTVENAKRVLLAEAVSVNDNPMVDMDLHTVLHGGNFHGDYVSLEMDKLKIACTRLSMLLERQLNFVLNPALNNTFPPFLNLGRPGLQLGLQAAQFTATSTTAENQSLSFPNYVHSIPNNLDNQDIVSMGTNSALLCRRVIENSFEVTAIYCMALAQAIDCGIPRERLAAASTRFYQDIRALVPPVQEDAPLYPGIACVKRHLMDKDFN